MAKKTKTKLLWTIFSTLFVLSVAFYIFFPTHPSNKNPSYCVFCVPKILNSQKIYEDEFAVALYCYKPIYPGHCLIIPKKHKPRFETLSDEEFFHISSAIKKVHAAVSKVFHTESYLLMQKNGKEAGQSVFHVHFHYIPKKIGDQSFVKFLAKMIIADKSAPLSPLELKENVEKIKTAIAELDQKNPSIDQKN
jgi:diadenosine tetraphosphate (Ap4A) HIT family hydrolase